MCKFDDSVSCPGLYGGLYMYGQNLQYKFKNSYGDFQNRNLKNHIELLVPGQIWDRIRDPGQILVYIRPSATSKPEVFGWRPGVLKQTDSIVRSASGFTYIVVGIRHAWTACSKLDKLDRVGA
jgi:hypothetical protein